MAPGFFHKLGEVLKKGWNVAKEVGKKVLGVAPSLLSTVAPALKESDNPVFQGWGNRLDRGRRGLETMKPIINRLIG